MQIVDDTLIHVAEAAVSCNELIRISIGRVWRRPDRSIRNIQDVICLDWQQTNCGSELKVIGKLNCFSSRNILTLSEQSCSVVRLLFAMSARRNVRQLDILIFYTGFSLQMQRQRARNSWASETNGENKKQCRKSIIGEVVQSRPI